MTKRVGNEWVQEIRQEEWERNYFLESLTPQASLRRYYRIYDKVFKKPLGKILVHDPSLNGKLEENAFLSLSSFLEEKGILVPKIFGVDPSTQKILLQDLGDTHLINYLSWGKKGDKRPLEEEYYQKNIEILEKFQQLQYSDFAFNWEKYHQEISMTHVNYFEKFLGRPWTGEDKKRIDEDLHRLLSEPCVASKAFTHRDLHSRNIMIFAGEMYWIDYQDARLGPICYDLVSLLDDCYYYLDRGVWEKLLDSSYEILGKKWNFTREEFDRCYAICLLQRSYKVLGTFSYQYVVFKNAHFLPYISCAQEKLKRAIFSLGEWDLGEKIFSKIQE